MKKKFRTAGLRFKLTAPFTLAVIIVFVALTPSLISLSTSSLEKKSTDELITLSETTLDKIQGERIELQKDLKLVIDLPIIEQALHDKDSQTLTKLLLPVKISMDLDFILAIDSEKKPIILFLGPDISLEEIMDLDILDKGLLGIHSSSFYFGKHCYIIGASASTSRDEISVIVGGKRLEKTLSKLKESLVPSHIYIYDFEGDSILETDPEMGENSHKTVSKEVIRDVLRTDKPIMKFFHDKKHMTVFRAFEVDGEVIAVYSIHTPLEEIEKVRNDIIKSVIAFMLGGIIMILLVGYITSKRISDKVDFLVKGTREIGEGNLDHRISVTSNDEIDELATSFNKMTENLQKSNEMKDLFIDIMRHDLYNPAGVVKGAAEIALKDEEDPDKKEVLDLIFDSSNRIIDLIENASRLAKLESGEKLEFKEEDLGGILRSVIKDMTHLADDKNTKITFDAKGKFKAKTNPLVYDVFSNLIGNAIKYGPDNSEVVVSIRNDDPYWKVSVADRGEGVADEYKESIFTRYERAHKGGVKGTGLGLAIVKKIVNAHNGKVWVEDNPEGGSIFYVTLPKK